MKDNMVTYMTRFWSHRSGTGNARIASGNVACVVAALLSIPTMRISAQISYTGPMQEAGQNSKVVAKSSQSGKSAATVVSLSVKDSTVQYVLRALALQSGRSVLWDTSDPKFRKRISVNIVKADLMDAIEKVLHNTGLDANIAPDGSTIMIRSRTGSDSHKNSGVTTGSISGRVIDSATKKEIVGANIIVLGTQLSAITQKDGSFRIRNVPVGRHSLSVKILGYQTQVFQVSVDSSREASITIVLKQATKTLSEVVTTATGVQRRVEVPSDIVKIQADEIRERAPVRNVVDLIEAAQVPGVLVTRSGGDPGASSRIRIRGLGSISQSNDPVMIIDGAWIDASVSRPSRFDELDPASIETIEIVRGPSAATLYGQDAANGVIVITTKKGKPGPTRWNFSYNRDWGQTHGTHPLFYAGVGTSPRIVEPQWCPITNVLSYQCTQDSVIVFDPNNKLLSREGVETNNRYVAQMDGGSPNVTYSVTLSTGNTIGVRKTADVDRIRFRKVGYKATSEFMSPSELRRNNVTTAFTFTPRQNLSIGMTLTGGQSDLKDNLLRTTWGGLRGLVKDEFTLDTVLTGTRSGTITASEAPIKTSTGTISSSLQYRPRGIAVINGNVGAEKISRTESSFKRSSQCRLTSCTEQLGERTERAETKSVYTVRLNATTSLNLGSVSRFLELSPSIGGDFRKTDLYQVYIAKRDIPVGDRSINAGLLSGASNITTENAIAGWFVNSTIGLFRRVYFDIGIRQDIGSAITSSNDAFYPKIGGSWLVSDESFWKQNRFINSLRLRSAIGHAAVQPDPSDINGKFVQGLEWIDGRFVNTSDFDGTGNSKLQPERSVELELGFDADMIGDRLNLVGTYAHKANRNTLVVRDLPPSFGSLYGTTRKENVAKVQNRTFELSAIARVLENKKTALTINYTLTLGDNKVVSLGNGISPFNIREARIAAGYPVAGAWGREVLGYRDENKDGLLSADEIILSDSVVYFGWSQPRYRAGYGFTLTLLNQLVLDSRISYQSRYMQSYQLYNNFSEDVNASLDDQARSVMTSINKQKPISDVRWNSASITYHLSKSIVDKFGGRSASVSLQGRDLGLWSNYLGRDPGINSGLLRGDGFGDDGLTPPRPRLYVLDFKIGL